jgi:hypothetical protein
MMYLGKILRRFSYKAKKRTFKGKEGGKRRKLDEASYFLVGMIDNQDTYGLFQFNYSAFLTAARSVLQYTSEEVEPDYNTNAKPGAKKWYQKAVTGSRVIKFGRKERDENIHQAPATPNASVKVFPKEIVVNVENVLAYLNKTLVSDSSQKQEAGGVEPTTYARPEYRYTSSRWAGPEDLLEVCRMYLSELEALVKDGVSKGYITW